MYSLQRQVKDRCISIVHKCQKSELKSDSAIEDEINQIFRQINLDDIQQIQKIVPGKEFFSKLHAIVYDRFHVNFSIDTCLTSLTANDINQELRDFFAQLH